MFLSLQPILLTIERWVIPNKLQHFAIQLERVIPRWGTYVMAALIILATVLVAT